MKTKDPQKVKAIYQATLNLVHSEGLSGIKMAKVAKTSGIATGTLYIYFESKAVLLNSLYQKLKSEREIYLHPELNTGPVKQQLKKLWDEALDYRYKHFLEAFFMEQFYMSSDYNETSRALSEKMTQGLWNLINRGKEELIIKSVDNNLLMSLLYGFMKETAIQWRIAEKPLDDILLDQSFQICWDAIKA